MSDTPLTDQRCDASEDNPIRPWTPTTIASNIVDSITRSYMWPCQEETKEDDNDLVDAIKGLPKESFQEYTSEHLEKALFDLKSSGIFFEELVKKDDSPKNIDCKDELVVEKTEVNVEINEVRQARESKATMIVLELSEISMSTEISYPANPLQVNENIETKPDVENISTQSSADRVKLNTQTTTEDLPRLPTPPQPLSQPPPDTETKATIANTPDPNPNPVDNDAVAPSTNVDNDRHVKKSKVPVLKHDHINSASSSTNVLALSNQNKIMKPNQKYASSRIPQRLSVNQTTSKEYIPSKSSANLCRTPALRAKSGRLSGMSEKQLIENALTDTVSIAKMKATSVKPKEVILNEMQLNASERQRKYIQEHSKLPNVQLRQLQQKQADAEQNKENQRVIIYKPAADFQQQTDVLPPCRSEHQLNDWKQTSQVIEEKHSETDIMCSHLLENIQIVENVLGNLPRDDAGNLTYNYALGKSVFTMTDDLQTDAQSQAEDNDNNDSIKKYQEQVYKNEPMVSVIETSTKVELVEETVANNDNDEDNDDEYEDYDEDEEEDEEADVVNKMAETPVPKKLNRTRNLSRESKTCLMGSIPTKKEEKPAVDNSPAICEHVAKLSDNKVGNIAEKQTKDDDKVTKNEQVIVENQNGTPSTHPGISKEEIAYEVNVFNMIQSQKINNILRMAMPHNQILLPVFVSSPSSIMLSLERELRNTLQIKRQASIYFNGLASKNLGKTAQNQGAGSSQPMNNNKSRDKLKQPNYTYYGSIIGPQIIAQHQATWAKPPFYYGAYKPVPAK